MIILINGSFGVGKTTTAQALAERIPAAHIFDPEDVGHFARHITAGLRRGAEDTDDFQDIRLWPWLTVATVEQMYQTYRRPLILPMTLAHPEILATIRDGCRRFAPVRHVCLVASLPTIQRRLQQRGDGEGSWPWRKAGEYVPRFGDAIYATQIDTETRGVPAVVSQILALL